MSHHYSGPDFSFPHGDARVDITDLYAFPKPGDNSKSVLILDVHPSVAVNPPGPSGGEPFASEAVYELVVDTNGDAVGDITFRLSFTEPRNGQQRVSLTRLEGPAHGLGEAGEALFVEAPVSQGREAQIAESDGYRLFAGVRSDPFFADVGGALNDLQFTGEDFFTDKDVASIVLEVPNRALGSNPSVGLWARTLVPSSEGSGEQWLQVDRFGHPGQINTYIPSEEKAAYNAAQPADDRSRYQGTIAHALEQVGHYPPDQARSLAASMLPDILRYDYTQPASYPNNGRSLTDDVFDLAFSTLTNQQISDGVGPHSDLSQEFPYLGSPHNG